MHFSHIILILRDAYNVKMHSLLTPFALTKVLKIKKYNNYRKYFIDGSCDSLEPE